MLWYENLIIFTEGIWLPEEVFVKRHADLCDAEHLFMVNISHERLSSINTHKREAFSLALMIAEGTRGNCV